MPWSGISSGFLRGFSLRFSPTSGTSEKRRVSRSGSFGKTVVWQKGTKGIISDAQVPHEPHVSDLPDEVSEASVRKRTASGDHAYTVDKEACELISRHFVPSPPDEGFSMIVHGSQGFAGLSRCASIGSAKE